jgi:hypothetical protein
MRLRSLVNVIIYFSYVCCLWTPTRYPTSSCSFMIQVTSPHLAQFHLRNGWKVSPVRSGKQLRSNLLKELGIIDRAPLPHIHHAKSSPGKIKTLQEPLKDWSTPPSHKSCSHCTNLFAALATIFLVKNQGLGLDSCKRLDSSESELSLTTPGVGQKRRKVGFCEIVTVIPIPRRDQYSDRMRKFLWDTPEVTRANLIRNTIEYAADGNDPRTVREEHQHILCPSTGNLIHPIHFELAKLVREKPNDPVAKEAVDLLNGAEMNGWAMGLEIKDEC